MSSAGELFSSYDTGFGFEAYFGSDHYSPERVASEGAELSLAGMGVIAWLLVRTLKGHFSAEYFTPVDLGGLYWHLVDLIWIYLFPLLYLIE